MKLKPNVGTILEFTPREGRAEFTSGDQTWTEPVIGFANVVTHALFNEYETRLETIVLDNGIPATTSEYLRDRENTQLATVRLNHGSN